MGQPEAQHTSATVTYDGASVTVYATTVDGWWWASVERPLTMDECRALPANAHRDWRVALGMAAMHALNDRELVIA